MNELQDWLNDVHHWYQNRNSTPVTELQPLIFNVPPQLWGSPLDATQSKAIACWLDACLRQFEFYRTSNGSQALQYLNLAYSRFQFCVAQSGGDLALKSWCMRRMQQLIVLSLEHLNQQTDGEALSHELLEAHVKFMAFHAWNDDQGVTHRTPEQ
ncbi:transcriptional regulator [Vibrio metoecus]|uniref:transcriptional regulator n=1 Tax=Vibrio metoecus TaxID=1481663 RepID=UPI0013021549|nr:transcriptional regulator [Vibrio metoecus]